VDSGDPGLCQLYFQCLVSIFGLNLPENWDVEKEEQEKQGKQEKVKEWQKVWMEMEMEMEKVGKWN
jgi:hypothetical protein